MWGNEEDTCVGTQYNVTGENRYASNVNWDVDPFQCLVRNRGRMNIPHEKVHIAEGDKTRQVADGSIYNQSCTRARANCCAKVIAYDGPILDFSTQVNHHHIMHLQRLDDP